MSYAPCSPFVAGALRSRGACPPPARPAWDAHSQAQPRRGSHTHCTHGHPRPPFPYPNPNPDPNLNFDPNPAHLAACPPPARPAHPTWSPQPCGQTWSWSWARARRQAGQAAGSKGGAGMQVEVSVRRQAGCRQQRRCAEGYDEPLVRFCCHTPLPSTLSQVHTECLQRRVLA